MVLAACCCLLAPHTLASIYLLLGFLSACARLSWARSFVACGPPLGCAMLYVSSRALRSRFDGRPWLAWLSDCCATTLRSRGPSTSLLFLYSDLSRLLLPPFCLPPVRMLFSPLANLCFHPSLRDDDGSRAPHASFPTWLQTLNISTHASPYMSEYTPTHENSSTPLSRPQEHALDRAETCEARKRPESTPTSKMYSEVHGKCYTRSDARSMCATAEEIAAAIPLLSLPAVPLPQPRLPKLPDTPNHPVQSFSFPLPIDQYPALDHRRHSCCDNYPHPILLWLTLSTGTTNTNYFLHSYVI